MVNKIKLKKLKGVLPLFWNSYQHMYDVRVTNIQNKINFLLITVSFLPLVCIGLSGIFENNYILLLPILFQFAALVVLLKSFFIMPPPVHWFRIEKTADEFKKERYTLNLLEADEFEADLIAELKAIENRTDDHRCKMRKIIRAARFLLIFSLFDLLLAVVFALLKGSVMLFALTTAVFFGFSWLYIFYYLVAQKPPSGADKRAYKEQIHNWLKK